MDLVRWNHIVGEEENKGRKESGKKSEMGKAMAAAAAAKKFSEKVGVKGNLILVKVSFVTPKYGLLS